MKINQVEELVGITKKNIRFYEEQGLISPARNPENGYREYSLKDVEELNKIKLLRQLEIPIEQIRNMQEGTISWKEGMDSHMIHLSHKQHNLKLMCEICKHLSEEESDLSTLQPAAYFEEMRQLEERGVRFMNVKKEDVKKRKIVPIIVTVLMVVFFGAMDALILWAKTIEPEMPIAVPVIFILTTGVVILGVVIALVQRLHEIKGGELDEATKY